MKCIRKLAAVLGLSVAMTASAQTKWDMPTAYPATNFHTENITQFVADVDRLRVVCAVADGTIPKADADNLCCIVGVFIHWDAADNKKIYDYNYRATKESIARAMKNEPSVDSVISKKETAKHPFA